MRKGYTVRVQETVGGDVKRPRESTFDDAKAARAAFDDEMARAHDDMDVAYMRDIGGSIAVYLRGYDTETGGEVILLDGEVRRPLHSPEALAFIREPGETARPWAKD